MTDMSPAHRVASFEIALTRYLDVDGRVLAQPLPAWATDADILVPIYRTMLQTRLFDAKAINLQRTGRMGTYASPLGQEAIGAGVASAMQTADVLFPSYREFSAQFWRGVSMTELLLYWGGDERGVDYEIAKQDFPPCVPIASQTCHAVGAAYAFKVRKEPNVCVCFLGDGASSKGDFYESLNAAGVWQVPVVFVVSNNQWAISVPVKKQTAAETLAQKAIAVGIPGQQVDGNDLIAVRAVADKAIARARAGEGPSLIEALTYRLGDHTTADDASRYRDQEEVEKHRWYDPLKRMRAYLLHTHMLSEQQERELNTACAAEVDAAVKRYLEIPPPASHAMFDYLFAELPEVMLEQQAMLND